MTCDECGTALLEGRAAEAETEAHLRDCEGCAKQAAETDEVLALAEQPALTVAEKAQLATLPETLQGALARSARVRARWRFGVGLTVAASLGALVTLGVGRPSVGPVAPGELAELTSWPLEEGLEDEGQDVLDPIEGEVSWSEDDLDGFADSTGESL